MYRRVQLFSLRCRTVVFYPEDARAVPLVLDSCPVSRRRQLVWLHRVERSDALRALGVLGSVSDVFGVRMTFAFSASALV